jgi:hypothetical protein
MDRDALARAGRRAQAEEALADERQREAALRRQVAEVVLEQDGARIDAETFAALDADSAERVRSALGIFAEEIDDDPFVDEFYVTLDDEPEEPGEDELGRLQAEIADSQRTQQALEEYIAALDRSAVAEGA